MTLRLVGVGSRAKLIGSQRCTHCGSLVWLCDFIGLAHTEYSYGLWISSRSERLWATLQSTPQAQAVALHRASQRSYLTRLRDLGPVHYRMQVRVLNCLHPASRYASDELLDQRRACDRRRQPSAFQLGPQPGPPSTTTMLHDELYAPPAHKPRATAIGYSTAISSALSRSGRRQPSSWVDRQTFASITMVVGRSCRARQAPALQHGTVVV